MIDETVSPEFRARWSELFDALDGIDLRLNRHGCAKRIGLASGTHLDLELRRRGLPRFRLLRDWYYVLRLHGMAQSEASLSAVAGGRGDYPSVLYRFMLRVTGRDWRSLSRLTPQSVSDLAFAVWCAHGAESAANKPAVTRDPSGAARQCDPAEL